MTKEKFEFWGFRIISAFFAILSFRLVYFISDLLSYFIQYIVRYRSEVVANNLKIAFPEKSDKDLKKIKREFYKQFSDMLFETVKAFSTKSEKIRKRLHFEESTELKNYFTQGKSCIIFMSHYANWEWILTYGTQFFEHKLCALYKPLRNKQIDKKIFEGRNKMGLNLFPMEKAGLMVKNNVNFPSAFVFIADQSPANVDKALWIDFFGKKTAVIKGAEQLAVKFNLPVFYLDVHRIKRGEFLAKLELLESSPIDTKEGEISRKYMKKLENIILKNPSPWLWSHRRWKKSPN